MLTNVGDEGGFAPSINTNEEALELIVKAIEKSKLIPGKDVVICIDVGKKYSFPSSHLYLFIISMKLPAIWIGFLASSG